MSTISFTTSKQGVRDLLAALPAPPKPATDRVRADDVNQKPKPGFNDLLRDSSETQQAPQRAESPEPVDKQPRTETHQDELASSDKPDSIDQEASVKDSSSDESQHSSDDDTNEQNTTQASGENEDVQPKETSGEAQVQAAANAAAAQLNVIDAVASDQVKAQAKSNATQQIDLGQVKQAKDAEQAVAKSQSSGAKLSLNAALPNQTQSATGQVAQTDSAAVVQPLVQVGDSAQSSSGDSGGDSSKSTAASTNVATSNSTSANASATTAFTLPDQAGSESRLPTQINTTTQSVDATRQAQAQQAMSSADNDSLNTARLTRGLANAVQQRGGAVTLRLTPPEMGTVRIQMQISGTSISATFHAESASAQTLLTNQLAQLRSSLESKGMSVERLSVQPLAATASSQNANQSQNQSDTQQQGQSQQQSANDGRSRGQYNGSSSGQPSPDEQRDGGSAKQSRNGFLDRLSDASQAVV